MDFEHDPEHDNISLIDKKFYSNQDAYRNIKLTLQYDGTSYIGWQRQKQDISIQHILETALKKITSEDITLRASGRTDASVHAFFQVANFLTASKIPLVGIQKSLNSLLPEDISIIDIEEAEVDFHSIGKSVGKCYIYRIIETERRLPLFRRYAWEINRKLNLDFMNTSMKYLIGKHDFSAFKASGSSAKTSIRDVQYVNVFEKKNDFFFPLPEDSREINLIIFASGFLRKMVRNIVGLIMQAGLGRFKPEKIKQVIEGCDRNAGYPTAPPQGLFLFKVFYDKIFMHDFIQKTENEIHNLKLKGNKTKLI